MNADFFGGGLISHARTLSRDPSQLHGGAPTATRSLGRVPLHAVTRSELSRDTASTQQRGACAWRPSDRTGSRTPSSNVPRVSRKRLSDGAPAGLTGLLLV